VAGEDILATNVIEVAEVLVCDDMLVRDIVELVEALVCGDVPSKITFEVIEVRVCEVEVFDCDVDVVDWSSLSLSSSSSPSSRSIRSEARSLSQRYSLSDILKANCMYYLCEVLHWRCGQTTGINDLGLVEVKSNFG
jgi:hypothetical protein